MYCHFDTILLKKKPTLFSVKETKNICNFSYLYLN